EVERATQGNPRELVALLRERAGGRSHEDVSKGLRVARDQALSALHQGDHRAIAILALLDGATDDALLRDLGVDGGRLVADGWASRGARGLRLALSADGPVVLRVFGEESVRGIHRDIAAALLRRGGDGRVELEARAVLHLVAGGRLGEAEAVLLSTS